MRKISGKEYIDVNMYRMAVVVRMGIEENEFTEAEIKDYIASKGKEHFDKALGMTEDEFTLLTLKELVGMLEEGRSAQR